MKSPASNFSRRYGGSGVSQTAAQFVRFYGPNSHSYSTIETTVERVQVPAKPTQLYEPQTYREEAIARGNPDKPYSLDELFAYDQGSRF